MIAVLFNHFFRPPSIASLGHVFVCYSKNILQAQSDILGVTTNAAGRAAVTSSTLQQPAVFGLFARWLEDNMPSIFIQPFPFTTIAMTCGRPTSIQYFFM